MAKKPKSKKSVKFDENAKNNDKSESKKNGGSSYCSLLVSSVIVITAAVLTYKIYTAVTFVPEMPKLDLNEWWGPNNTRNQHSTAIRPYRIVFSDAMISDLRSRFESYRRITSKPKTLEDSAWTYGVNYDAFAQFFSYWVFKYDFKKRERFLNKFDHFLTNIQGLDIHFIHVKPKVEKNIKVYPLLLLHGWPGSIREFYDAIPLLTTERPGYDYVFEVIVPSLPGFGYSQGAVRPGLSAARMAVIMKNLMQRLGFTQYYIQGGDFGSIVGMSLATMYPEEVLGFHNNIAIVLAKVPLLLWIFGGIWPSLVEKDYTDRLYPVTDKLNFYMEESGYNHIQSTKPDTLGIALRESPAGLAAYILEKFVLGTNYDLKFKEDGGLTDVLSKTDILDNIVIYWFTGSITTSMRIYKEKWRNADVDGRLSMIPTKVPTWALRLKHEIFFMPEWLLKWKYTNLLGSTTLDYGGHFAAFELPEVFSDDVFKAVKKFQEFRAEV